MKPLYIGVFKACVANEPVIDIDMLDGLAVLFFFFVDYDPVDENMKKVCI